MTVVPRRRRRGAPAFPLIAPATLFVIVFLALPLLILVRYSFNEFVPGQEMRQAFTLTNYAKFATDPYYHKVLLTTINVSLICTAISIVLAFPVAYVLAKMRGGPKNAMIMLVVFPLLIGNVIRAAGWQAFLGSNGFLNGTLLKLHLISEPLKIFHTTQAVIIGITAVLTPYMILTLQSVLESIDWSLEEAAANLGAPPLVGFRRIVLPLAIPGLIAGGSLIFILSMNAYATPVLLGGSGFAMMPQAVYDNISSTQNWPFGAVLAFVLMAATIVITVFAQSALHRRYGR